MSIVDLLNDDYEIRPTPLKLWVDGVELECLGVWEDTKEGARLGGYIVRRLDGSQWAIDHANPKLGVQQKGITPGAR